MLKRIGSDHDLMTHPPVKDIAGYAILIDVESNSIVCTLLRPHRRSRLTSTFSGSAV